VHRQNKDARIKEKQKEMGDLRSPPCAGFANDVDDETCHPLSRNAIVTCRSRRLIGSSWPEKKACGLCGGVRSTVTDKMHGHIPECWRGACRSLSTWLPPVLVLASPTRGHTVFGAQNKNKMH
jgi:hypothetical protein